MERHLICAAALASLLAMEAGAARAQPVPGVQDIAPGVRVVDGAKVPRLSLDATALQTAIKEKPSFRAVKKLLGGDGVTSPGGGGSTVHMYKLHDTVTGKDMVAILFVQGDRIVDHLLE
jgi:hypothetical protein